MASFIGQRGCFFLVFILQKLANIRVTPELDREKQLWDQCCIYFSDCSVSVSVNSLFQWMVSVMALDSSIKHVFVQVISHGAQLANAVHYHISHAKLGVPCCETSVFVGMQMPLHEHESALGSIWLLVLVVLIGSIESIHPGWGGSTFLLQTY